MTALVVILALLTGLIFAMATSVYGPGWGVVDVLATYAGAAVGTLIARLVLR